MTKLIIEPEAANRVHIHSFAASDNEVRDSSVELDVSVGLNGSVVITANFPKICDKKERKAAKNTIIFNEDGEITASECIGERI